MNSNHQRMPQSGRGFVFTWGSDNDTGALGHGDKDREGHCALPVPVAGLAHCMAVAAGPNFLGAVTREVNCLLGERTRAGPCRCAGFGRNFASHSRRFQACKRARAPSIIGQWTQCLCARRWLSIRVGPQPRWSTWLVWFTVRLLSHAHSTRARQREPSSERAVLRHLFGCNNIYRPLVYLGQSRVPGPWNCVRQQAAIRSAAHAGSGILVA